MVEWDVALRHRPWEDLAPRLALLGPRPSETRTLSSSRARTSAGVEATRGLGQGGVGSVGGPRRAALAPQKPGVRRRPD